MDGRRINLRGMNPVVWNQFIEVVKNKHDSKRRATHSFVAEELNLVLAKFLLEQHAHNEKENREQTKWKATMKEIREVAEKERKKAKDSHGAYAPTYLNVIPRILARTYGKDVKRTITKYAAELYNENILTAIESERVIHNAENMFSRKHIHQEAVKEHRELTTNKHLSRKAWEEENKLNAEQDAERRKQLFTSFLTPKGKEIYNNNRRDSKIEVA